MTDAEAAPTTLRDGLQVLYLQKRKIQVVFVITVLVALVGVYLWPETYEVQSKILVKRGREIASPSPTVLHPKQMLIMLSQSDINTEIQILKNKALIAQVVDSIGIEELTYVPAPETTLEKIKYYAKWPFSKVKKAVNWVLDAVGLKKKLPPRDALIAGIYGRLSCEPAQDTNVLIARLGWGNPVMAPKILNELVGLYVSHHLMVHSSPQAHELFREQRDVLNQQLVVAAEELARLKNQWQVSQLSLQRELLLRKRNDLEATIFLTQQEQARLGAEIKAISAQLEAQPEHIVLQEIAGRNPAIDHLSLMIVELQDHREKLALKYGEDSPSVADMDQEIAAARQMLSNQAQEVPRSRTTGINEIRQEAELRVGQLRRELKGGQARLAQLEQSKSHYDTRLAMLNDRQSTLATMEQRIERLTESVALYDRKAEEARINSIMDEQSIANVSIVEPAMVPLGSSRPRKMLILGIAVGLGLVLGVALGLSSQYLDRSITLQRHVEEVGVRLLTVISSEPRARGKIRR